MRAFFLSNINHSNDRVTALPFLLNGDTIDYYHYLTKYVPGDWDELMRVLKHRFHCIPHKPVYLSRMLTLKESGFPRHANYV